MNLDDLQQLAKDFKAQGKKDAATDALLSEASTALADILAHLESSGPDLAKALATALAGVQLQVKAGASTINVSPTPVRVEVSPTPVKIDVAPSPVAVNVAASPVAVNVMPSSNKGTSWRVAIDRDSLTDVMTGFTITRQ